MKKFLAILALAAIFVSCTDPDPVDDGNTETQLKDPGDGTGPGTTPPPPPPPPCHPNC